MVRRLRIEKQALILNLLVEGNSVNGTARIAKCAKNTVLKFVRDLGPVTVNFQNAVLYDIPDREIELDEIWSFCHTKSHNLPEGENEFGIGDVWTWVAIGTDTRLIATWFVGDRTYHSAKPFLEDLRPRLRNPEQVTLKSDGLRAYRRAIKVVFGSRIKHLILRSVDPEFDKKVSTSRVERQNRTIRMGMRRMTRKVDAHSKKVENHMHATCIHFMHYNFSRPHETLSNEAGRKTTPAMAAGITNHVWTMEEIIGLLDHPEYPKIVSDVDPE